MKKVSIVLVLFSALNMHSMDNKEREVSKHRRISHHEYFRDRKKPPSSQELEILEAKKKAEAQQLRKDLRVCLGCYIIVSSAAVVSYHAGAYAVNQLKNAATNYFFNTTNN